VNEGVPVLEALEQLGLKRLKGYTEEEAARDLAAAEI